MYFATHGMQDSMISFMRFESQPSKTIKNKKNVILSVSNKPHNSPLRSPHFTRFAIISSPNDCLNLMVASWKTKCLTHSMSEFLLGKVIWTWYMPENTHIRHAHILTSINMVPSKNIQTNYGGFLFCWQLSCTIFLSIILGEWTLFANVVGCETSSFETHVMTNTRSQDHLQDEKSST